MYYYVYFISVHAAIWLIQSYIYVNLLMIILANLIDLGTSFGYVIPSGENFTCIIDVKNTSKRNLTINLTGVISSMQYTGQAKLLVKRQKFEKLEISAGKSIFLLFVFFLFNNLNRLI